MRWVLRLIAIGDDARCLSTDLAEFGRPGGLAISRTWADLARSAAGSAERSTSGGFRAGRQSWAAAAALPVLQWKKPPEGLAGALHRNAVRRSPRFLRSACNRIATNEQVAAYALVQKWCRSPAPGSQRGLQRHVRFRVGPPVSAICLPRTSDRPTRHDPPHSLDIPTGNSPSMSRSARQTTSSKVTDNGPD